MENEVEEYLKIFLRQHLSVKVTSPSKDEVNVSLVLDGEVINSYHCYVSKHVNLGLCPM
ncbi:MAG: hypothetical protein M0P12_03020 [Paludibacteraceae bacterium]|nr:hypothetical protein [Paludibacteraceae bacterium]